eukprot:gene9459-10446_t
MALSPRDGTDGYRWRCPARLCRATKSIRYDSFFEKSKLPLRVLVALIYCWSVGMRLTTTTIVLGLSEPTVVNWYNLMREECSHKLLALPFVFGGVGHIVEIDESFMIKRKYQLGDVRAQHDQWVFGMYDRTTHVGYIQFVEARTARVLIPIIRAHITPGSTIYSHGWASYRRLPRYGYQHGVVIHSDNIMEPITRVHINGVEAHWSRAKQEIKARVAMLVVCLDLGDTLTLAEKTEELDAADCQTEDNMPADKRNATARELRRKRSKRKDQSDYMYY